MGSKMLEQMDLQVSFPFQFSIHKNHLHLDFL